MKKIKLMLVAFMAMIGVSVSAQHVISPVTLVDENGINYNVQTVYVNENIAGGLINTVKVAITNDFSGATLSIPDEVTLTLNAGSKDENGTPIEGAIKFRVVGIIDDAFRNNRNITTVNIGKYVAEIGDNAFNSCTGVTAINFAEGSMLESLGDYCFGNTPKLKTLDFDNCTKLTDISAMTASPFHTSASTEVNNYLTTLKLNKLEEVGTATLPGLTALTSVEFSALTILEGDALYGDVKLASLELPATCQTIESDALQGTGVSTLTINSLEAKPQTIETTVYGTTDVLTTLTFKGVSKVGIEADAFNGTKLTSVTFAEVKSAADDIEGSAFTLADAASTITITKISTAAFAAGAFVGPATATNKVALNIGDVAADLANKMVTANVGAATTGKITKALNLAVFGDAATISFGEIADGGSIAGLTADNATLTGVKFTKGIVSGGIPAGAFEYCLKLKTVEFQADLTVGAVAAKAFGAAADDAHAAGLNNITGTNPYRLTVTYRPSVYTAAFATSAFATETPGTGPRVLFVTNLTFASKVSPAMFDVEISFEGMTREIEMLAPTGQTSWYGKFVADGTNYEIASTNEAGKKVVVYEAYIDENDETKTASIVMLPLTRVSNKYVVKEGQAVIVRAWGEGNITATATTQDDTHNYDGTPANKNDIRYYEENPLNPTYDYLRVSVDASVLYDNCVLADCSYMYAVLNLAKNTLNWGNFTAEAGLMPKYTLYVYTKYQGSADRGARLDVIWADGSEDDATAIQTVKKANAENGAIYNLSGQKVSASYKGVVIKDGKKFIQK